MAISTQTEALIGLYNQRIELSQKQLSQVDVIKQGYEINVGVGSTPVKIYGVEEVISYYNVPIENLDNRIIEINDNIKDLQEDVLFWGQEAMSVGCGTTSLPAITVYQDILKYETYSFTSPNPYSHSDGNLISSNSGIGTFDYISQVSIGTYRGGIGSCYSLFVCTNEICSGYATTINSINSQIETKQNERDGLITIVNELKKNRSEFQIQKYAYEETKNKLDSQIQASQNVINFLQNPDYDEWL